MRKSDATRIRLEEAERRKLTEITAVTGIPISACIRALITAFVTDFEKNNKEVRLPFKMDSMLHIWSTIREEYAIPPYIDSLPKLEKFLASVHEHWEKMNRKK